MVTLTEVYNVYIRGNDRICGLDKVSLDIAAGTFCAFVGPSGCGKSTLLHVIAGLDVPTSGTIHLDGRSTAGYNSEDWTRARRQAIGIVFQAFHLIAVRGLGKDVRRDRGCCEESRVAVSEGAFRKCSRWYG